MGFRSRALGGWHCDSVTMFFFPGSEVTVLTNSTFDVDVTLDAKRYWVVDFYAPWSGHRK